MFTHDSSVKIPVSIDAQEGPEVVVNTRQILDTLPLSVYVKDRHHRFIYVNKAAALALGLSTTEEARGKTDGDFFAEDVAAEWKTQETNVLKGLPIEDQVEKEVLKSNPTTFHWVLTCKYPLTTPEGQVVGIVGISKQIDKEHDALTRRDLAVRGAQVGLWHVKCLPDSGSEAWFSPRWKELLGYKDEEIPNRRAEFEERVHPDDYPRLIAARNRYLANPKEVGHYECEFRMKHKNGRWIWIRSHGEAELSADGKACLAFAGSHTDITAYRDEHELHEEILSMLSALVFMKDSNKRFIFVNPELARYYGTTKDRMEGERERDTFYNPNKEQTDRFERDDKTVLDNDSREIQENGLVIDNEEIINKATGEIRRLKTTKKLFMYPSRDPQKHVLGISTDITDAIRKAKNERDAIVDAHVRSRHFLSPLSSVQDLLDFRKKLPEAFKSVNAHYACLASGALSNERPWDEWVVQAYTAQWKKDFLNLRLARVQRSVHKGAQIISADPLLRQISASRPVVPLTKHMSELENSPMALFLQTILPKSAISNCHVIFAAGASQASGPKRLADIISFVVLPPSSFNREDVVHYFIQRFTESLGQHYRNSELYTERKQFLTDVTHQLVTPLINTIDICTSAIEKAPKLTTDHITERLFEARGLVRHCAMFTRAFLAASQSDEAELVTSKELNEVSIKVTRLMIEVGRDFRVRAQTKGLIVRTDDDSLDAIGFQQIDEEWVRHALMNLVDNAVKYTAAGSGGVISLFGEHTDTTFALCVANPSCIPIRAEYRDRIFDRWFRSPEAEQEEVQGTGIGLALANAVVTAHGGRIDVTQGEFEEGAYQTSFRLWFPSATLLTT